MSTRPLKPQHIDLSLTNNGEVHSFPCSDCAQLKIECKHAFATQMTDKREKLSQTGKSHTSKISNLIEFLRTCCVTKFCKKGKFDRAKE